MMPIVFWASLPPWLRLKAPAETYRRGRSHRSTLPGGLLRRSQLTAVITRAEARKPTSGETTMNAAVVPILDQPSTLTPPFEMPAPMRPPTSACDELDGSPHHQVRRFQVMAPPSAPM